MTDPDGTCQTTVLDPEAKPDDVAPDGSEIRLLPRMKGGSLCHCTLHPGRTSSPVVHRSIEEIWYILEGKGEVWRKAAGVEEIVRVNAGTSLTIPPGTAFQFRNTGADSLCILIVTMPPWPGPQEAEKTVGAWPAGADALPQAELGIEAGIGAPHRPSD